MERNIIPQTLYHYTRLDNLTSIIPQKSNDAKLVFWLTHFRQMNDAAEGEILDAAIKEFFPEWGVNPIPDMYVLSMCGSKENLPLWREYADDAKGIAIALDRDTLLSNTSDFHREIIRCEYGKGENYNNIRESLQKVNDYYQTEEWKEREKHLFNYEKYPELRNNPANKWILKSGDIKKYFRPLLAFKRPHYHYEDEYRLTIDGYYADRLKYKVRNNRLIEYREYHVNIKALKGIYVGSNNDNETVEFIKRYIRNLALKQKIEVDGVDLSYKTY